MTEDSYGQPMLDWEQDSRIRTAAFDWLRQQVELHGDVLPRDILVGGFVLDGVRVPLIGPQGIFKPRILTVPLTITTSPEGPYADTFGDDGFLRYKYRGMDPNHTDNRGLRTAMQRRLPLAYFHGIIPGRYLAAWPVYVINDDPGQLTFTIAADDPAHMRMFPEVPEGAVVRSEEDVARRAYVTASVRVRLHQRAFRERVLDAYQRQCAFCRLRHEELLDAAHIVPDTHPEGEPVVRNGLSLCMLHHAAFDRFFIGLRPDLIIEVRRDILEESDGPTLVHAIQSLHGSRILIPTSPGLRPAADLVQIRYEQFRTIAGDLASP